MADLDTKGRCCLREKIPTYRVKLQRGTENCVVFVQKCPVCGVKHTHGVDDDLLAGEPSHRVEHCPGAQFRPRKYRNTGEHSRGYFIQLGPDHQVRQTGGAP